MDRLCPRPFAIITELLFSYFTLALQSNIVVSAQASTYSLHVLRWSEVTTTDSEVLVTIRSTKNKGHIEPPSHFLPPLYPRLPLLPCNGLATLYAHSSSPATK